MDLRLEKVIKVKRTKKKTLLREEKKIYYTRLLGHFAPILYFNCEHVLFEYIVKKSEECFAKFVSRSIICQRICAKNVMPLFPKSSVYNFPV